MRTTAAAVVESGAAGCSECGNCLSFHSPPWRKCGSY